MFPKRFNFTKWAEIILILIILVSGFLLGQAIGARSITRVQSKSADDSSTSQIPLNISDTSDTHEILMLMLHSHEKWQSIQVDGISHGSNGDFYELRLEVIQESPQGPYHIIAETIEEKQGLSLLWINDGHSAWNVEKNLRIYSKALPAYVIGQVPEELPRKNDKEYAIFPHPLTGSIRSQLADLVFPAGIAQMMAIDLDRVTILGMEDTAGRSSVVMSYDQNWASRHKLWVDAQTGIVMKQEMYDKAGIENGNWWLQIEITQITFDSVKDGGQFILHLDGYREVPDMNFDEIVNSEIHKEEAK